MNNTFVFLENIQTSRQKFNELGVIQKEACIAAIIELDLFKSAIKKLCAQIETHNYCDNEYNTYVLFNRLHILNKLINQLLINLTLFKGQSQTITKKKLKEQIQAQEQFDDIIKIVSEFSQATKIVLQDYQTKRD